LDPRQRKQQWLRWLEHVAYTENMRTAHIDSVEKHKRKVRYHFVNLGIDGKK
jgi:hypothetical protein